MSFSKDVAVSPSAVGSGRLWITRFSFLFWISSLSVKVAFTMEAILTLEVVGDVSAGGGC